MNGRAVRSCMFPEGVKTRFAYGLEAQNERRDFGGGGLYALAIVMVE